jgi:hypothetical protein
LGQTFWADSEKRQTNSDAWKKDGISENFYPEEINQNSRVPDPRRGKIVIAPTFGGGVRECRYDWSPALHDPFVPEMAQPTASPYFPAGAFPFPFHREQ